MDEVEKLAKELYIASQSINGSDSGYIYEAHYNFKAVARFVLKRVIEVRIQEHTNQGHFSHKERIDELRNQLNELESNLT